MIKVKRNSPKVATRQDTVVKVGTSSNLTDLDFKKKVNSGRLLGEMFDGVQYGTSVPSSKAVVSLTDTATLDGFVITNAKGYDPTTMYNIADCNWSAQTISPYGAGYLNYAKANTLATTFEFTTMFEGKYLCIGAYKVAGIMQDYRLWIDDQEVTEWWRGTRAAGVLQTGKPIIDYTGPDAQPTYLNINFANRGLYKIRVSGPVVSGTSGLMFCNAEGKFHAPKKQKTFGIISDSWYDTISGTNTNLNAGSELAARMGWRQWNMANGGSGFVNPAGGGTPLQYGSDAVFTNLLKAPDLDFLLLNGSVNDMGYTDAVVVQAMKDFFTRWRTVRPDTPIVWQGCEPQSYFENAWTSAAIVARETLQTGIALADPNVIGVIRPALEDWLTGTGNTSAPNGTGNQDFITGPDGVHLSKWGTIFNGILVHQRLCSIPTWRQL